MSNSQLQSPLDVDFRDALRAELVRTVTTTTAPRTRHRWTRRRTLTLGAVVLVCLGGGGAAVAAGILPVPGADQVVLRASARTVMHTGAASVDLGRRPVGATNVELVLTCLTPGTFTFADGANLTCSDADTTAGKTGEVTYTMTLQPGQTSTEIITASNTRWSLTSTYSTHTPTDWAVNANGNTYGTIKDDGSTPDLVAVWASNGEQGYAYGTDLNHQPAPTSPADPLASQNPAPPTPRVIPVYASDGTTVIGDFQVG